MIRWATIVLSVAGLGVGVLAVANSKREIPDVPLARPASVNPFDRGIAALGFVEPAGRVAEIASPEPGMVSEVLVQVGDVVRVGDVLMRLDTRQIDAEILQAKGELGARKAEVARWEAQPRAEDLPPLESLVARARAGVENASDRRARAVESARTGASSARDLASAEAELRVAQAELASAEANLARVKAGGWAADRLVLDAGVAAIEARIASLELLKERLTVRSPKNATVLRREVEPGEYVQGPASRSAPPLVLGDLSRLHVRAQVDEEDVALIGPGSRAQGRTRGALARDIPLKVLRIEPFARPKPALSGANTERTDTRVIDVVLEVQGGADEKQMPPVSGQAIDVFLEAVR